MRRLLVFLLVVAGILLVIGEIRGLFLGFPGQTPVLAYKVDHTARAVRRTISRDSMPVRLTGDLRHGSLRVSVVYERPESFQTGAAGLPPETVFEKSFRNGERVNLNETISEGRGNYTVQLEFSEGTGLFTLRLPPTSEL